MKNPWIPALFLLGACLLLQSPGWAQTPLGSEIRVNDVAKSAQTYQTAATAADGRFLVTWQGLSADESLDVLWGQWYSPEGQRVGSNRAYQTSTAQYFQPAMGPGPLGGILAFWRQSSRGFTTDTLRSGEIGGPRWLTPPRSQITLRQLAPRFVRPLPQGGYVIALIGSRGERVEIRTFLAFTDAEGRFLRAPGLVYPARFHEQYVDGVAVSPKGRVLVTWSDEGPRVRVLAQLFSSSGRSLNTPVQVHDNVPGRQFVGRSAALGDQGFVVVWEDEDYETGRVALKMRLLDPNGKPKGPVQRINEENRHALLGGDIAADKDGNFFVVWQEGGPPGTFGRGWDVWGRLFRPNGRPAGPKQVLNSYTLDDQTEPFVTTGANRTFIVVWQSYGQDGDAEGIFGQIFAASPADEVCALSASKLRCDLGRSGGQAEFELDLLQGEPIFGDWDGDGRQDPCSFDAGSWNCDLDHIAGTPKTAGFPFGQAGDRPLLGDLDGDGRAEACVQRGAQLLCDSGRDGGEAEVTLTLGQPTEAVSFADVDGDGKDEACVIRGASFLCDTGHDGGVYEWNRTFGSPGTAKAVFGDADGDGKAEPCILEGSELLCDSGQDGGGEEVRLSFPLQDRERLVLVNLDGL